MVLAEFGTGQVFWSMLWFFLFFLWIWLLITIFADIFRSDDLGGWGKAIWTIFVILIPYLGVLVYLIVRGHSMGERAAKTYAAQEKATQDYIRNVASGGGGTADQIARLADLKAQGAITDAEFEQGKAKILGSA